MAGGHASRQHGTQQCRIPTLQFETSAHLEQLAKVLLVLGLHLRQALQLLGHVVRLGAAESRSREPGGVRTRQERGTKERRVLGKGKQGQGLLRIRQGGATE